MGIGINGFGRIGRQIFRILHERGLHERVKVLNDLTDSATLAHLLKYDSNYGKFKGEVSHDADSLTVDGHRILVTAERDPADIPWGANGVKTVVEATGIFTKREKAALHKQAGAENVLISAPSPDSDRKSTRLNSSHVAISYAVFCLKKKKQHNHMHHQRNG